MSNITTTTVDQVYTDDRISIVQELVNVSLTLNNTADILNTTMDTDSTVQNGIIKTINTDTTHSMNPMYGVILLIFMISIFCFRRVSEVVNNKRRSSKSVAVDDDDSNDTTTLLHSIQTVRSPIKPIHTLNTAEPQYTLASMLFGIDIQHSPAHGYTVVDRNNEIIHYDDTPDTDVKQRRKQINNDSVEMSQLNTALQHIPLIMDTRTHILNKYLLEQLLTVLPTQQKLRDLQLVYNTSIHGYSLKELYRLSQYHTNSTGYLTIIEDSDHYVFGCYTSDAWSHKPYYYGNAYTFVFTLVPYFQCYKAVQLNDQNNGNNYYMLGKADCIAVGGGNHFSIWLDEYIRAGQSLPCDTFNSPTLSKLSQFKCINMEVWAFV